MVNITCDKCGKKSMSGVMVALEALSDPHPSRFDDMVQGVGICTGPRKSFILCSKCYQEIGFPNIYYSNEEFGEKLKDCDKKEKDG